MLEATEGLVDGSQPLAHAVLQRQVYFLLLRAAGIVSQMSSIAAVFSVSASPRQSCALETFQLLSKALALGR